MFNIIFIDELLGAYNSSYHTTIKTTPNKAFNTTNKQKLNKIENKIKHLAREMKGEYQSPQIKRGDYVRISNLTKSSVRKDKFNKKYIQNYSTTIYKVIGFSKVNKTYLLQDVKTNEKLTKRYYEDQLLLIDYKPDEPKPTEQEEEVKIIIDTDDDIAKEIERLEQQRQQKITNKRVNQGKKSARYF